MQLQRAGVPLGPELLFRPDIALAVVLRFAGAAAPLPGNASVLRLVGVRFVGARILLAVVDLVVGRIQGVILPPTRNPVLLCSYVQHSRSHRAGSRGQNVALVSLPRSERRWRELPHNLRHTRVLMHRAARVFGEVAGLNSPPKAERSLPKAPLLGSCLSPRKALKVLWELRVWRRMLFEMS